MVLCSYWINLCLPLPASLYILCSLSKEVGQSVKASEVFWLLIGFRLWAALA